MAQALRAQAPTGDRFEPLSAPERRQVEDQLRAAAKVFMCILLNVCVLVGVHACMLVCAHAQALRAHAPSGDRFEPAAQTS